MPNVSQVRRLNYNGEDLGMGFNSDTGLAVGTALEFAPPDGAVAQEAQAEVSIVTSHEQLMRSIHMSADLEGRYAFVSGGAKADFARNTQYNSTSTFVVARMVITNTVRRGKNFKLRAELQHLLDTSQKEVFDRAFGDSFVRAHYEGGEFYAVMRVTSVDSKTESKLATSLHAAVQGGIGSVDFKAALDTANSDNNTRSEFSCKFYQKGGLGRDEIGTTLDVEAIKKRLQDFPDAVENHPFPFFIEVATYDTVPLPWPPKEQQEAFLLALKDANAKKLKYLERQNDCEFAADHPEYFYQPPPRDALLAAAGVYLQLVNGVLDHSVRLAKGQINPPQLFDPSKLTPPVREPDLILRKKDVGLEAGFADFWVNKDLPATLRNDRDLIMEIGYGAMEELNDFNGIRDPGGDPIKTLRMQGEALARVVASFKGYDWDRAGMHWALRGKLDSLAKLPAMLPKTVTSLSFTKNEIASTAGLQQFSSLVNLDLSCNRIETIDELEGLQELRTLRVVANRIVSLEPLRGCPALETLDILGNQIADLGPLAACKSLKSLQMTGTLFVVNDHAFPTGNPISNSRALSEIPAFANPFVLGNVLKVRAGVLKEGPEAQFTGTATRMGDSPRFHVMLTRGGETRETTWALMSMIPLSIESWNEPSLMEFYGIRSPTDLPSEGTQITLVEAAAPRDKLVGFSFAIGSSATDISIGTGSYPVFNTGFPFATIDAVMVS
jgi:hypothetical protein